MIIKCRKYVLDYLHYYDKDNSEQDKLVKNKSIQVFREDQPLKL